VLKELKIDLKRVASALGKIPTRDEYMKHGRFAVRTMMNFTTYGELKAAVFGEEAFRKNSTKTAITEKVNRSLEIAKPREPIHKHRPIIGELPITMWMSDLHEPYSFDDGKQLFYARIDQLVRDGRPPKLIGQVGDLFDLMSSGRFPVSRVNAMPQDKEVELGRKKAELFWETCRKISPTSEFIQLIGNHDIRPLKSIQRAGLGDLEVFVNRGMKPFFEFEGVKTIFDEREEFFITPETYVIHGWATREAGHLTGVPMNVIHGHTHRGGVFYRNVPRGTQAFWRTIWELDCGFMGDPLAKCFGYMPQKIGRWTKGWGETDEMGPRFVAV